MKRNTIIAILTIAAAYAGIYFYQRYKRGKANESKATEKEALDVIKDL